MSGPFWTDEKLVALKRLTGENLSAAQIGSQLGCTRNAVIGKLLRLGGKAGRLVPRANTGRPKGAVPRMSRRPKTETLVIPRKAFSNGFTTKGGKSKPPTLAGAAPEIAADHALTVLPTTFLDAISRSLCLFYSGDPFSPDGPSMPVCGAGRPEYLIGAPPYCARHLSLRYRPRAA